MQPNPGNSQPSSREWCQEEKEVKKPRVTSVRVAIGKRQCSRSRNAAAQAQCARHGGEWRSSWPSSAPASAMLRSAKSFLVVVDNEMPLAESELVQWCLCCCLPPVRHESQMGVMAASSFATPKLHENWLCELIPSVVQNSNFPSLPLRRHMLIAMDFH
jgi:hypothetical protein